MSTSHRTNTRALAAFVLAAAPTLLFSEFATAAVGGDAAPSVTVRYHDLNLGSPEGVASLYGRIRGSAAAVCRSLESRELTRKALWNDCVSHAVANAVNAVHNRPLSAYHWQRIRGWKHHEVETSTTLASQ